ncbi:MAG: peptidylprolyl isomerase [Clostridia bacterium]|nr:peptidylprolyl isomerase [Clostridia bacterium]
MAKKRKSRAQRQKQKRIVLIAALIAVLLIAGWIVYSYIQANRIEYRDENDPVATITLQNGKKIVVELYPDKAPNTVANFVELANSGFYDGLTFHRVIKDFMIQGGDPKGDGTGGPGYSIKGEFSQNGFTANDDLYHVRGTISMARATPFDSAGSQFFIVHQDSRFLDGAYAAFGMVVKGMENVDAVASAATNPSNNRPLTEQVIRSIRVDTKGVEYKAEKLPE